MKPLKKPAPLKRGDTVAIISPSSGMAGDSKFLPRYEWGKKRLEEEFGLHVVVMPNALKGSVYVREHPEKRAEDLMEAFRNPQIQGIITAIGGDDSIRLLPYLDFDSIGANPKILTGLSDITSIHAFLARAGIGSFYGACLLTDFAENDALFEETKAWIEKTLFQSEPLGCLPVPEQWIGSHSFDEDQEVVLAKLRKNSGYQWIQGEGTVKGRLYGGCLEVLSSLRGTPVFPAPEEFEEVLLFLETSPLCPDAWFLEDFLRSLGASGILERINGIIFGKPLDGNKQEEYHGALQKVLKEYGQSSMPVLGNAGFGHNAPRLCLPYGVMAELNAQEKSFTILESAVCRE